MTSSGAAGIALSTARTNEGDIKSTNTDIDWIKKSLERIEKAVGTQ